jgi:hypothetical protein
VQPYGRTQLSEQKLALVSGSLCSHGVVRRRGVVHLCVELDQPRPVLLARLSVENVSRVALDTEAFIREPAHPAGGRGTSSDEINRGDLRPMRGDQ